MTRYAWYKSKGICPRCGCEDAAPGRVCCLNCLDARAIATIKWRSKNDISEKNKANCKKRYAEAKKKGCAVGALKERLRTDTPYVFIVWKKEGGRENEID